MNATVTKTKSAEPMGTYKRTALDDAKDAADFLIIYAYGSGFDIRTKHELSGRGIKVVSGNVYHVTEAALAKLKTRYSYMTDF
jgi:hypothetical protein